MPPLGFVDELRLHPPLLKQRLQSPADPNFSPSLLGVRLSISRGLLPDSSLDGTRRPEHVKERRTMTDLVGTSVDSAQ